MSRTLYFISHPDVDISPSVPVTQWPLSKTGQQRMRQMLSQQWISDITAAYCSSEQKAIDGAKILSEHLSIPFSAVQDLGENDRSSTGFLQPDEFEKTADKFFAEPNTSIRGWETASAAQRRIVDCVSRIIEEDSTNGAIAIVSHGAVGTLLYCDLAGKNISRRWDQPSIGGGNYMTIKLDHKPSCSIWKPIDSI